MLEPDEACLLSLSEELGHSDLLDDLGECMGYSRSTPCINRKQPLIFLSCSDQGS